MRVLTPDLVDVDGFDGPVMTAAGLDRAALAGLRVGVLATTAAHVRVLPTVVAAAADTRLFLTRPVDVLPASPLGVAVAPVGPLARRVAALHRWRALPEAELRRKLTPLSADVPVTVSRRFLRAAADARCTVVAWPVTGIVAAGVRTADGREHHLDVLVTA